MVLVLYGVPIHDLERNETLVVDHVDNGPLFTVAIRKPQSQGRPQAAPKEYIVLYRAGTQQQVAMCALGPSNNTGGAWKGEIYQKGSARISLRDGESSKCDKLFARVEQDSAGLFSILDAQAAFFRTKLFSVSVQAGEHNPTERRMKVWDEHNRMCAELLPALGRKGENYQVSCAPVVGVDMMVLSLMSIDRILLHNAPSNANRGAQSSPNLPQSANPSDIDYLQYRLLGISSQRDREERTGSSL